MIVRRNYSPICIIKVDIDERLLIRYENMNWEIKWINQKEKLFTVCCETMKKFVNYKIETIFSVGNLSFNLCTCSANDIH